MSSNEKIFLIKLFNKKKHFKLFQAFVEEEEELSEAKTFHEETDWRGDQGSKHSEGRIQEQSRWRFSSRFPSLVPRLQLGQ